MLAIRPNSHSALFAVLFALASGSVARAQAPAVPAADPAAAETPSAPPAAPAAPATAHDIVRLTSGGVLRGTIAEHMPGSHVIVVLITGEVRRVEAAEIAYAGPDVPAVPSPDAPPAPASPAPVTSTMAPPTQRADGDPTTVYVQLSPSRPDAAFYADIAGQPRLVCTGPCETNVPRVGLSLGMAVGGREPVPADVRLNLRDGDVVDGMYRNRRGGRIAARIVGGIALGSGLLLLAAGGVAGGDCRQSAEWAGTSSAGCNAPLIAGGLDVVLGLGLLIGSSAMDDEVRVSVRGRPDAALPR